MGATKLLFSSGYICGQLAKFAYDYIFTHMCLEFLHDVNVSHTFGGLLIGWVLFALILKYAYTPH